MARARLLKPGFFTNDKLASLPAHARLLFVGLWTLADREGRLPDRPKWIKGALFPYENPKVERLLGLLDTAGFIWRYQVAGERYIVIPNFSKHQHVHVNEGASTIPAPEEHRTALPNGETNPSVTTSTSKAVTKAEAVGVDPVSAVCASFAKYGKVTGATVQAIEEDVTDFSLEWVEKAERQARNAGFDDKPPWGYVHSILERWKKQEGPDEPRETQQRPRSNGRSPVPADSGAAFAARL